MNWVDLFGLVCGKNQDASSFNNFFDYFGTSIFGFSGEEPVVGRESFPGFKPGGLLGSLFETLVPAGHNFGKLHDDLVNYLTEVVGLPDFLVNIPTMPPAYAISVAATLVTGVWEFSKLVGKLFESFNKGPGSIAEAIDSIGSEIADGVKAIGGAIVDAAIAIGRAIEKGVNAVDNMFNGGDSASAGTGGVGGVSGADMGKGSEDW